MNNEVIKLPEERVDNFDNDSTAVHTSSVVRDMVRKYIPHRNLLVVDVGGGNGSFIDELLNLFPGSHGINVELSEKMCEKNRIHANKEVHWGDFIKWASQRTENSQKADIVTFNFVLHHFVGKSWKDSRDLQFKALECAAQILSSDGLIIVYEINYNGFFIDDLPGFMIHGLTKSTTFSPIARRMGANTAGYGVCFRSRRNWLQVFQSLGLALVHEHIIERGVFVTPRSRINRLALGIKDMSYHLYFISKKDTSQKLNVKDSR